MNHQQEEVNALRDLIKKYEAQNLQLQLEAKRLREIAELYGWLVDEKTKLKGEADGNKNVCPVQAQVSCL